MAISNKILVITGGAGFIGSTIAERLSASNQIVLFDNFSRNTVQRTQLAQHPHVRIVKGDVLDFGAVLEASRGADIVVHAASIAGIDTVIKSPVTTMDVNMIGTANTRCVGDRPSRGRPSA